MSVDSTGISVLQRRLGEDETLTTFNEWRNNLRQYLSQDPEFKDFMKPSFCWKPSNNAAEYRGLQDIHKVNQLHRFLSKIADVCPSALNNAVLNESSSLSDIYNLIRSFYRLTPSENSFMRFAAIKREIIDGILETPGQLYQRMREFIKDTTLSSSDDFDYLGNRLAKMSATTERLVVLRWLEVLNPLLPALVAEKFADDLRMKTIMDLQPVICERMDQLLLELQPVNERHVVEELDSASKRDENDSSSRNFEKCVTCGAVQQLSNQACGSIPRTSNGEVGEQRGAEGRGSSPSPFDETENVEEEIQDVKPQMVIIESPQYKVKMNSVSVTMVLDTGCTGSLISSDICLLTGVEIRPSKHCAVQADGDSHLKVLGEIYTTVLMDDCLSLPVNALVVSKLKAGFIVGMAFMKRHKVKIDMENNTLSFQK